VPGKRALEIIKIVFLILSLLIFLNPFAWLVSTSLKSGAEVAKYPPKLIPENPVWLDNFAAVFRDAPVLSYFWNSIAVAVLSTLACLFTSSLAGYILGKFRFPGVNVIFAVILATMMVPFPVILIPIYLIIRDLGLYDTIWALVVPRLVSAFGIFLLRQYTKSIPGDLMDAARIDGCREFGIYLRVVLPQCKPALSALSIFIFMQSWNSFLWPLVTLQSQERFTVPLGLVMVAQQIFEFQNEPVIMAFALLSLLPVLIVFLAAQRRIIAGITLSGLKY
jgi:multiple sugar transport system permease protein